MSSGKVMPLLMVLLLMVASLCGCAENNINNQSSENLLTNAGLSADEPATGDTTNGSIDTNASADAHGSVDTEQLKTMFDGLNRDVESIKAYISVLPIEKDKLAETGGYIISQNQEYSGAEAWNTFVNQTRRKIPAKIMMAQLTDKGNAAFYYLNYDGKNFYMLIDSSADSNSTDDETYMEMTYRYLNIVDTKDDSGQPYHYILLSDMSWISEESLYRNWSETYADGAEQAKIFYVAYIQGKSK